MERKRKQAPAKLAVIGHVCLDIRPSFPKESGTNLERVLPPGGLCQIGETNFSIGGLLKSGITAHRLGIPTTLFGPLGRDPLGHMLSANIHAIHPQLAEGLFVCPKGQTSHTIVIQPGGRDRAFAHHPGVNDLMTSKDLPWSHLQHFAWAHFGYLNLMEGMWRDKGAYAVIMFSRLQEMGMTTSLDLTVLDPESEAGQQDWLEILSNVVPYVSVAMLSLGDLDSQRWPTVGKSEPRLSRALKYAQRLLDLGVAVAVIKLGKTGIYVRVTEDMAQLVRMNSVGKFNSRQEFLVPAYKVKSLATTGAGDRANAAFIAAAFKGHAVREMAKYAAACGAYSVSQSDPEKADPEWKTLEQMVALPAKQESAASAKEIRQAGFHWCEQEGIWLGRNDRWRTV